MWKARVIGEGDGVMKAFGVRELQRQNRMEDQFWEKGQGV